MGADSLKPIKPQDTATQSSSGWDPFTVWRERVHKPRAKTYPPRTAPQDEPALTALLPAKQSS